MKIVHVICSLCTGGAELMLIDILARQSAEGHDVALVVINRRYERALLERIPPEVKTVLIDRPEGSRNPLWIAKYNIALRGLHPDVIHFHHDKAAGMTARRFIKAKTVATVHDTNITLKYYPQLDAVCSISRSVREDIERRYHFKSPVVYNGVRTEQISRKKDTDIAPRMHKIVQVSRLNHNKKGQDLLIKAVAALRGEGYDITVDFIGEGESEGFLKELAAKLGVSDAVNFLGLRDRAYIYEHLCDYDLLVQPSRYEGFGLTVAEAMVAKVPVLVSDTEGPMEVIGDGEYGATFESGSADSLKSMIGKVADEYDHALAWARNESYPYAVRTFDISETAVRYISVYKSLF